MTSHDSTVHVRLISSTRLRIRVAGEAAGITASGPSALKMFDHDYNSPAENAQSALELLNAWVPRQKMKVSGGDLRGETAILEVEGEIFAGQRGLTLVRMVKSGPKWLFEEATRVGMVP